MPPEIVSLILDFLEDDPDTLRVCALVSSDFLAAARRLLFRHVFLLPMARQPAPRSSSLVAPLRPSSSTLHPRSESLAPSPTTRPLHPCVQLDHLLAMSPDIAHHIHRLSIVDGRLFPSPSLHSDPLFPSLSPHSPRYFSLRDRLNGPHWFLSTPPRILFSLFQKLHLSALDLVFQDGPPVRWDSIPPDILTLLHSLWTSPTLQALQLRRVAWDSPAALSHFTRTLARGSVRHLTLHHVQLFPFPPLSPQHHARPRGRSPTPRTHTLGAKPNMSYHPSPSNHLHPLHLDSLAITGPAAPTVLQSLFLDPHSLQKLSIPSDQFPHLLQFNMTTLQELILNDRLASGRLLFSLLGSS